MGPAVITVRRESTNIAMTRSIANIAARVRMDPAATIRRRRSIGMGRGQTSAFGADRLQMVRVATIVLPAGTRNENLIYYAHYGTGNERIS